MSHDYFPTYRFYNCTEDFRDAFSRDRDRIIHSSNFRALEYKTQVFLNNSGDFFRTRLTHSLEVSQIARSIAKQLGLCESLAETIALSHDLGHTPFGHAGGEALDEALKDRGYKNGFEHNFQSFRVVTHLEKRYQDFVGLNLTYSTLEGILKHSPPYDKPFLSPKLKEVFKIDYYPSFEAIIVDFSDEIAYISHDIDDGIHSRLIDYHSLKESELVCEIIEYISRNEGLKTDNEIFNARFSSRLISYLVYNFLEFSKSGLKHLDFFHSTRDKYFARGGLLEITDKLPLGYPKELTHKIKHLKKILFKELYRHEYIVQKMFLGRRCIKGLLECFLQESDLLPVPQRKRLENGEKLHRVASDYIASLSDRYALELYEKLGYNCIV